MPRRPAPLLAAALLPALLLPSSLRAADVPPAPPPLRVAQVLLFRAASMADVEADLARLKAAGVDTVFVRVFQNRGDRPLLFDGRTTQATGVYFPTTAAPVVADHLTPIAAACRRLGLSIYAWMTTRACDWILEGRPDLAEMRYDPPTGRVLPARTLNIFHPAVRNRLTALFRDLAAADIDGVLFQDDLVLRAGEGLSPEAIEAYVEDGGPAVSAELLFAPRAGAGDAALFPPESWREAFRPWTAWKNRRLLDLASGLMAAAREVRPGLRFALNLYYETVLNPPLALAWYAQSIPAAEARPFDYYSLMSYHRQIGRELRYQPDEAIAAIGVLSRQAAAAVGRPSKVIVKIQALDWESGAPLPAAELERALAATSPGVSLAVVRGLDDPPLDVLARHFRQAP
jgi:biofilm PGA synthesis lipoprotein PgaB